MQKLLLDEVKSAGLSNEDQQLTFPVIVKNGVNQYHKNIHYYFNYSGNAVNVTYAHAAATDLLSGKQINTNEKISLTPWDLMVVEENK